MTLQIITIDNSVLYISKKDHSPSEQTPHISKQRGEKPNKTKKSLC